MYDYIIVGAGSAGCVMANRLSADPNPRVLLVEVGGRDWHPMIHLPGAFFHMFTHGMFSWVYKTTPQEHLDQRVLHDVRGKVLGGSSSINGMIYCRGAGQDYDGWRQRGNVGWAYADVLPYFKRSESHELGESVYHGGDGLLRVSRSRVRNPMAQAWIAAGQEAGYPYNEDISGETREGFGPTDLTTFKGRRMSPAATYLRAARARPNLTILTEALARRILFNGTRATGLEYARRGRIERASAGEIILAAGVFESPHLLMLSGIGEASQLRKVGLDTVIDLKGVGRNFHDHLGFSVQFASPQPVSDFRYMSALGKTRALGQYIFGKTGPLVSDPIEAVAAVSSGVAGTDFPDLKFAFVPLMVEGNGAGVLQQHGAMYRMSLTRLVSRGAIMLRSADPGVAPEIDANYLSAEIDRRRVREAVKIAREIFMQPAYAPYKGAEVFPGIAVRTDAEIDAYIRRTGQPDLHGAGSCRMGNDALAVVDDQLRVHGAQGLRVADASIMPDVVSGNTNAAAIMIAEKASDMIRGTPAPARAELACVTIEDGIRCVTRSEAE